MTDWNNPTTPPASDWEVPADSGLPPGAREFQADFDTPEHVLSGTSLTHRPDAVSLDYLTAFCFGPNADADVSLGAYVRAWRVRVDGHDVYIARANDALDDWAAETLLFSYTGAMIQEADISFEQAGRPVVCAQRPTGAEGASEVWLYWFKPSASAFVFEMVAAGRTPRIILDNPQFSSDSDIDVFYLNADHELVYRVQRELYANETATPYTGDSHTSLEEVFVSLDNRMVCLMSKRTVLTGRYSLERLESTLLPFMLPSEDAMTAVSSMIDGTLIVVVLLMDLFDVDTFSVTSLPTGGELELLIIFYPGDSEFAASIYETMTVVPSLLAGGTLVQPVLTYTMYDLDKLTIVPEFRSGGTLVVVVIQHTLYDKETLTIVPSFRSGGTLV